MNFTIEDIKNYKEEYSKNRAVVDTFTNYCLDYMIEEWNYCEDAEEFYELIDDIIQLGCNQCVVSRFIYDCDCVPVYEKYKQDISDIVYDTGCTVEEIFGGRWDESDPLCAYECNQSLALRFAFENKIEHIVSQLECEYE